MVLSKTLHPADRACSQDHFAKRSSGVFLDFPGRYQQPAGASLKKFSRLNNISTVIK